MAGTTPDNFRDIGVALDELQAQFVELNSLVKRSLLVNQRYRIVKRLQAANTLVEQMRELLKRSGMLHRLGFVEDSGSVQPVMLQPAEDVKQPDATIEEGSGLSGG